MAMSEVDYINRFKNKVKIDTFTLTNGAPRTHIDVGFEPKYLCVYFIPDTTSNICVLGVYDADIMGRYTKYYRGVCADSSTRVVGIQSLPNNNNPLESIDSTGFYVASNATWMNGTWHYFALG